ncbi:hypothetical protein V7T09_03645 [Segatella copri]|uniref:coiled-coil domain-containing protein n=1 Tax=Segatella copri TaxID=165179 RepID=UPI001C4953D2|nr:hypothetical protein [Segatella copri]MBW0020648.1 hypothetical protein [Segatella copri]MBW0036044.1 hypothetical protein [Segatella copri]
MKRKYFSALLMGALTIASVSTFTSCKDYDDDINMNTSQIKDLQEQLKTLQTALDQAKNDATTAHANFATKADLNSLQTEVANLVTAEKLQKAIDDLNAIIAGKADKAELEKLAGRIDAIDGSLNTIGTTLNTLQGAVEAAQTNLETQGETLDKLKEKIGSLETQLGKKVDLEAYNTKIDELQREIGEVKLAAGDVTEINKLKDKMEAISKKVDKVAADANVLTVMIAKQLKSLVLKPDFYWEGLEGIEAPWAEPVTYTFGDKTEFNYKVSTAVGFKTIKATVNDKVPDRPGEIVYLQNGAIAKYHMNPSTASLEGAQFSFFTNLAEVYTRSGDETIATPKEAKYVANGKNTVVDGILSVPFTINTKKVNALFTEWAKGKDSNGNQITDPVIPNNGWEDAEDNQAYGSKLPFIALQAQMKDTTITSDYAVVTPAKYILKALADNTPETVLDQNTFVNGAPHAGVIGDNHLYTTLYGTNLEEYGKTPADALTHGVITMPATHSVVYNETIDLKPFVETHFDYETFAKYGKSYKDQTMTDAELEALGLHYEFIPIDYYLGEETTSETAHFEQIGDKTSGVFAPRSVDADGKTIKGQTATKEAVEREPLVRVNLVDGEGNIVLYGYIKVRIVEKPVVDMKVEVNLGDLYFNCGDEGKMTWSQVENLILSKLGTDGMTKQTFENEYYLENEGGFTVMPTVANGGTLYNATDKWYAVRYSDADKTKKVSDADSYGRVWYTPHDNATGGQGWDNQTNVLVWNFTTDANAGKMNAASYKKLMEETGVSYASKGENTKALYTWVRFVHKLNGTSIWVKLNFAPTKLHFEYGKIANKDLHHWFQLNSTYVPGGENDLDVHANVPTPAEYGQIALTADMFDKDLLEYWRNKKVLVTLEGNKDKFDKFYNADGTAKTQLDFGFVLPKKGVNSTVDAVNGTWDVKGASGSVWTLTLADNNHKIVAIKQDGASLNIPEIVAELRQNAYDHKYSILHYFGDEGVNDNAATDLLNNMGRRDAKGNDIKNDYLTNNIDKTFTAYIEVTLSDDPCYQPLVENNLFNVRFLRPINVAPKNVTWTDALNAEESVKLTDLVSIKDWRDYSVLVNGNYADNTNAQVPYEFYNITDLAVIREEIRSDAMEDISVRTAAALTDAKEIAQLPIVDEVPSLTSYRMEHGITTATYLKVYNGNNQEIFDSEQHGTSPYGIWTKGAGDYVNYGKINYVNNGGGAQIFHIYVPIAVKYAWGNVKYSNTNLRTSGVKTNLDYTQKVWAVITVNKTVNSGAKRH